MIILVYRLVSNYKYRRKMKPIEIKIYFLLLLLILWFSYWVRFHYLLSTYTLNNIGIISVSLCWLWDFMLNTTFFISILICIKNFAQIIENPISTVYIKNVSASCRIANLLSHTEYETQCLSSLEWFTSVCPRDFSGDALSIKMAAI